MIHETENYLFSEQEASGLLFRKAVAFLELKMNRYSFSCFIYVQKAMLSCIHGLKPVVLNPAKFLIIEKPHDTQTFIKKKVSEHHHG
mgnify:CR=1 FL=1